ncbi:MAG: RNA methyltransferase [Tagaea sp.]|nr:RNA methyltransferase [Tagaea sp.]
MKGYFGIGVEGISKPMNLGALARTAHAFGASFVFTVAAAFDRREANRADTSDSAASVPIYDWATLADLRLPVGCDLVGIELAPDAIELPSFRHPRAAAYILGPERGSLSPEATALCAHVVKIPMKFCVNVALAGGLVMYDRVLSLGKHAPRPVGPGGPREPALDPQAFGPPRLRKPR